MLFLINLPFDKPNPLHTCLLRFGVSVSLRHSKSRKEFLRVGDLLVGKVVPFFDRASDTKLARMGRLPTCQPRLVMSGEIFLVISFTDVKTNKHKTIELTLIILWMIINSDKNSDKKKLL